MHYEHIANGSNKPGDICICSLIAASRSRAERKVGFVVMHAPIQIQREMLRTDGQRQSRSKEVDRQESEKGM